MPKFTLRYARPDEAAIRTLSFEAENFVRAMEMVREADAMPVSLVEDQFWRGSRQTPERWIGGLGTLVLIVAVFATTSDGPPGSWVFPMVTPMILSLFFAARSRRTRAALNLRVHEHGLRPLIQAGVASVPPSADWARLLYLVLFAGFVIFTFVVVLREPLGRLSLVCMSMSMLLGGLLATAPITHRPYPPDLDDPNATVRSS